MVSKVDTAIDLKELKWMDINNFSKLSWKNCQQAEKLSKILPSLTVGNEPEMQKIRSLKSKVSSFKTKVSNYKPSLCRIIWQIITFSFTFFKVRRIKRKLLTIENELKRLAAITLPSVPGASSGSPFVPSDEEQKIHSLTDSFRQRKITVVTKALELIDGETYQDATTKVARKFFQDKLDLLDMGMNAVIGGNFYHCTGKNSVGLGRMAVENKAKEVKGEGVIGILQAGHLLAGNNNVYGFGVYAAVDPEYVDYGPYSFALDEGLDEMPNNEIKGVQLIRKPDRTQLWAYFQAEKGVPIDSNTAILSAPDDELEEVKEEECRYKFKKHIVSGVNRKMIEAPGIQIIPRSVANKVRDYIIKAEDSLGIAYLPKKSLWAKDGWGPDYLPDRYKKVSDHILMSST